MYEFAYSNNRINLNRTNPTVSQTAKKQITSPKPRNKLRDKIATKTQQTNISTSCVIENHNAIHQTKQYLISRQTQAEPKYNP